MSLEFLDLIDGPQSPAVTLSGSALTGVAPRPLSLYGDAPELPATVKLGAVLAKAPKACLGLAAYLDNRLSAVAATLPPKADYYTKAAAALARMYLNDRLGCCVISGKAHDVGVWSGNDAEGAAAQATDQEVLNAYNRLKAGPGDSGCVITDVLDAMRAGGIVFGGVPRKIDGYVSVDNTNATVVRAALYLFGSLTIGVNLPQAWTQNDTWDATNSRIVGGHDVSIVGYDADFLYVSSWGRVYRMTWRAFTARNWVTECYAKLAPDWYGKDGKAAAVGLDATTLKADLAKLGGGQVPDVDVPPAPPGPQPPAPVPPTPVPDNGRVVIPVPPNAKAVVITTSFLN